MNDLVKYAFEPWYKTAYHSALTDTEVCVQRDNGTLVISFYGMNSPRDLLFTPPFYRRALGRWVHAGTFRKFLSVMPFLSSQLNNHDGPVYVTGFSMGAAVGMIAVLWIIGKYPDLPVGFDLLAPYKAVIGFPFSVRVTDKDLFPRWPFLVQRHHNEIVNTSPYRWRDILKNHYYMREVVTR